MLSVERTALASAIVAAGGPSEAHPHVQYYVYYILLCVVYYYVQYSKLFLLYNIVYTRLVCIVQYTIMHNTLYYHIWSSCYESAEDLQDALS